MRRFELDGDLPLGTTVLEASAGTGKTYAIAALATRVVVEGAATLPEIMMVTFSRAATMELRSRVRERFEETLAHLEGTRSSGDPRVRALGDVDADTRSQRVRRLRDALATFDDATIATTHEFCHRMLAGLGSLADQEPRPTLVEDPEPLVREVALDVYLRRYAHEERPSLSRDDALSLASRAVGRGDATLTTGATSDAYLARVEFAAEVRDEVERRKVTRGLYTYDDMLTRLQAALEDPRTGRLAGDRIASRYRWVLIDEFQDTDHVQWSIVRRAFADRDDINVVLIGDPKQAIYAFRGADVHSYLDAVSAAEGATLGDNWRSDARLVRALDALLRGTELGHERIVVHEVAARINDTRLEAPAPWDQPVRLRVLPGEPASVSALRRRLEDDLAADIAGLLHSGATVSIGEFPERVAPRHVAVLVRSTRAGERVLHALRAAGIPAVFSGEGSVWTSDAAADWLAVLRALEDLSPANQHRAALTSLVGWTFTDLATASETQATRLAERLRGWLRIHGETGMAGLTETIMREHAVAPRLLSHEGGERLLTDLRHVAQNLQAAEAREGLGLSGVVQWLAERIRRAESGDEDERTRRLETDRDAVTIMTIHRSKGLQFPIVYLPDAADRRPPDRDAGGPIIVRDPDGGRLLDVGGRGRDRARRYEQMLADEAGEELRVLYVALTRAQCQVTAYWMNSKINTAATALHRVLFRGGASRPDPAYPDRHPSELSLPPGVVVQEVPAHPEAPHGTRDGLDASALNAPRFTRDIDQEWRRTSYTGLTSAAHEAVTPLVAGTREDDESSPENPGDDALSVSAAETDPVATRPSPMADLPGGTQFGSLVHAMLEHLDTGDSDLETAVAEQARHWLSRLPVPGLTAEALTEALLPSLRTRLGPLADDVTLAEHPRSDRLPELDFELELVGDRGATLARVADLVEAHLPPGDALAAYPARLRAEGIGEQRLTGFLTGSIDVLMRVGQPPRHLVVDYKTNRIGPVGAPVTVGAYTHAGMAEAMMQAHYPLQALLYGVATHRFLRWRQPGYDPDTHLGGVLYLFVRGMAGPGAVAPDGRPYGVFDWRPPAALVTELSELLEGRR